MKCFVNINYLELNWGGKKSLLKEKSLRSRDFSDFLYHTNDNYTIRQLKSAIPESGRDPVRGTGLSYLRRSPSSLMQ